MDTEVKESMRARRYCFTWNNYPNGWEQQLLKLKYKYVVVGREVAPTTGTKHLQGYVEFANPKMIKTMVKAMLPNKLHWSVCKGSAKQNYEYCTKDDPEFYEQGEISEQGKRMDLEAAMEAIKGGMNELDFCETHTMVECRYPKFTAKYRMLVDKQNAKGYNKKNIRVYWGETATGKTRSAVEEFPDAFILREGTTGWWWDGYDGEDCVIVDEFRGNLPLSQLLGILDGYACQVSTKGGSRLLKAKTIILTSNTNPKGWYKGCDQLSRDALFRRFDEVKVFGDPKEAAEEDEIPNFKFV